MEKAIKTVFPGICAPHAAGIYHWVSSLRFSWACICHSVNLPPSPMQSLLDFHNYTKICYRIPLSTTLYGTLRCLPVVTVLLINVLAFAVALLLTKKIHGTNVFRTVFFMPNLIGGIILGYIWQLLLNGILLQFNRTLTYSSAYGFWGLVILMCWQQIGYMMIIYIAGIQNIPGELIEAAKIDGASSQSGAASCHHSHGYAFHHHLYLFDSDKLFQAL